MKWRTNGLAASPLISFTSFFPQHQQKNHGKKSFAQWISIHLCREFNCFILPCMECMLNRTYIHVSFNWAIYYSFGFFSPFFTLVHCPISIKANPYPFFKNITIKSNTWTFVEVRAEPGQTKSVRYCYFLSVFQCVFFPLRLFVFFVRIFLMSHWL